MINNLVRDVAGAFRDHYDTELIVIVSNKYYYEFIHIANCYSVKTQIINESDHHIVVMAIKYKRYLTFMKTLQYEHGMNLTENITIDGSTKNGLIKEVYSFEDRAA